MGMEVYYLSRLEVKDGLVRSNKDVHYFGPTRPLEKNVEKIVDEYRSKDDIRLLEKNAKHDYVKYTVVYQLKSYYEMG